jgi:hypothetical protein
MIRMLDYKIICTGCGKEYQSISSAFRCSKCHAVLEVVYDYSKISRRELGGASGLAGLVKFSSMNDMGGKTAIVIVTGNNER